jgi:hypothetical protein
VIVNIPIIYNSIYEEIVPNCIEFAVVCVFKINIINYKNIINFFIKNKVIFASVFILRPAKTNI